VWTRTPPLATCAKRTFCFLARCAMCFCDISTLCWSCTVEKTRRLRSCPADRIWRPSGP
jgi:hypothetical protein